MVRIEKLSMKGFKSFANKTAMPFPAGFNVICGANGSGKSNVIDSLCFVLGVRSAKSIRAEKLDHLIFNGGKKRAGAKYGVVNLYLDNADGQIQGMEENIKITRKVNKNGVSAYKINGKTVNRRKIIDTLADSGIQADGHNIIMQGDVTNLIDMTPMQRRGIIDEISGIAEFEDKKTKAERELEKVDNKLKEAEIRLSEKEKAMKKLEREQKMAKDYKRLEEEKQTLIASIIKKKLDIEKKNLDVVEKAYKELTEKFGTIENDFNNYDDTMEKKQAELQRITSKALKSSKDKEAYNKLDMEITKHKNKIESNIREIQRLESIINRLSESDRITTMLKKKTGVYGSVAELFKTDKKYGVAIETAAGGQMKNIVVKTDGVAEECINYLKNEKLGRATFLPLNKIRYHEKNAPSGPGIIDFAINLIDYDSKFEAAMKYVFASTLVVEDIKTARKLMGRYRMVTLDGDLIQKSGAMTGGFRQKKSRMAEISKYREDMKALEGENEYLRDMLAIAEEKMNKINKEEEKEIKSSEYDGKISEISDELNDVREKRKKLYDEKMKKQSKLGDMRLKKTRLETRIENLEIEFEEFKNIEKFIDGDLDAMQEQRKSVIDKLRRIGNVNMKAIEDFESMKMLYDDLKKRVEKIISEKGAILNMVDQIESRRREVFMKAFDGVNENFQELFQEIGEGTGHLELEEPDDIRSGLVIRARPKGKKMLSIDSMSGGEKTLTALAFLFAVQMYKPAPFYVLDEVDAALDKLNSKRVGTLIKKQSEKAQFIVITHNDVTIKMADQVYGVSMEDGVSKVMAIKMPEN